MNGPLLRISIATAVASLGLVAGGTAGALLITRIGAVSIEELERCALADFDLGGALVTAARCAASSRHEPSPHPLTPGHPAR